jgi:hypothetical protein
MLRRMIDMPEGMMIEKAANAHARAALCWKTTCSASVHTPAKAGRQEKEEERGGTSLVWLLFDVGVPA